MSRCSIIDREKARTSAQADGRRQAVLRRLEWHASTGITVEDVHASVATTARVGLEGTRAHLEDLARRGLAQNAFGLWWPTTDRRGRPITPTPPVTEEPPSEESTMSACQNPATTTDAEELRRSIRTYLEQHGTSPTADIAAHVCGYAEGASVADMGRDYQLVYRNLQRLYEEDVVRRERGSDPEGKTFIAWSLPGRSLPEVVPAGTVQRITIPSVAKLQELHAYLDRTGALYGLEDVDPLDYHQRVQARDQVVAERVGQVLVALDLELDENLEDDRYVLDGLDLVRRHLEESFLMESTTPIRMAVEGITADEGAVLRERIAELERANQTLGGQVETLERVLEDARTQLHSYGQKDKQPIPMGIYRLGEQRKTDAADLDTILSLVEGLLQDCGVPVGALEARKVRVAWVRDSFTEVARRVRALKAHSRDELLRQLAGWLDAAGAKSGDDIESRIQFLGDYARELEAESSHLVKLNQEAHDVLDTAGAPRGGAPAHRIRSLIVKLSDGVLPMTVTDSENGNRDLYRLTVDSIAPGHARRGGIPDHLTLCREDLTGLFHPAEERVDYVSEHLVRAAVERAGCDGIDLDEMSVLDLLELLEGAAGHSAARWPWPTEDATELEVLIGVGADGGLRAEVLTLDQVEDVEDLIDNCYGGRANWVSVRLPVPLPERPRVVRLGGAA